jgi:hypothetical protein
MPSHIAFGKDFGITVDAEPDEIAERLAAASPGELVPFEGTLKTHRAIEKRRMKKQTFFVNRGGLAYIVRVGAE